MRKLQLGIQKKITIKSQGLGLHFYRMRTLPLECYFYNLNKKTLHFLDKTFFFLQVEKNKL